VVILTVSWLAAYEALFFLLILRSRSCCCARLAGGLIAMWGRRKGLVASCAGNAGEEAANASALIAGLAGFCSRDEGGAVSLRTSRCRQQVCLFVQLDIDDSGGLIEWLHVRVLRKRDRLFHELGPDGGGGLRAAQRSE